MTVSHKKKDSEHLPSLSSDSTARLTTRLGKEKTGINILPSHFGPKIRHKKRLHSQMKKNGEQQKVELNYDAMLSLF